MGVPISLARRAAENYLLHRAYCASFELTYNCNARCQHCHQGEMIPRERLATPQRLLEVCGSIRPIVASMSGGESLIRKELEEIVCFFRREDQGVCRTGERSLVVNPDGTLSPCGPHIRDYPTRAAMLRDFTAHNTCTACYTSTRANSERPARHLFLDHMPYLLHRSTA